MPVLEIKALAVGVVVGLIFSRLGLPIPAPPALAGVLAIVGISLGYRISTLFSSDPSHLPPTAGKFVRMTENIPGRRLDLANNLAVDDGRRGVGPEFDPSRSAIHVRSLSKTYQTNDGSIDVLQGVDLTIERGEFVSVIGVSGCGKSTLLRIVGGLLEPTAGSVDIGGLPPREAQRQKNLGFVFSDAAPLPWLNVVDNVELPL